MRNIESFLKDTQRYVSGDVRVRMRPYCFELLGVRSDHDLMDATFACYGEENKAWTAEDVKGFTRMLVHAFAGLSRGEREERGGAMIRVGIAAGTCRWHRGGIDPRINFSPASGITLFTK